MGCRTLWRFFANKKHKLLRRYLRNQRSALTKPESRVRIDIQGSIFPTIRYAYSRSFSLDVAHKLVLKRIARVETHQAAWSSWGISLVLRRQSNKEEAKNTSATSKCSREGSEGCRQEGRWVCWASAEWTQDSEAIIHRRTQEPCKSIWMGLGGSRVSDRLSEKENWTVVRSPTEADVQIAADCNECDIRFRFDYPS